MDEEESKSIIVSQQSLTASRSDTKVGPSAYWIVMNEFLFPFLIRFLLHPHRVY